VAFLVSLTVPVVFSAQPEEFVSFDLRSGLGADWIKPHANSRDADNAYDGTEKDHHGKPIKVAHPFTTSVKQKGARCRSYFARPEAVSVQL
jgi:hypothetical protein